MLSLCNHWEFVAEWFDGFATGEGAGEEVRLPHTVQALPQHYADHHAYQTVCGYRRKLELGEELKNKKLFVQFDGAAHIATCKELAFYDTGITPVYGDKLICLSTCEYTLANGRLVVMARRIS